MLLSTHKSVPLEAASLSKSVDAVNLLGPCRIIA
jgi:hypothetical protein